MRLLSAALLILVCGGCATVPPANAETAVEENVPVRDGSDSNCDAAPAQGLVGRTRTADVGTEALRLSGARALRWIPEGTMVTMDYRQDRLNLELDRENRITRIRCG
jgi:hypothetical protein